MSTSQDSAGRGAVQGTGDATVGVPVSDQDQAVQLFVGVLGMEKRAYGTKEMR